MCCGRLRSRRRALIGVQEEKYVVNYDGQDQCDADGVDRAEESRITCRDEREGVGEQVKSRGGG